MKNEFNDFLCEYAEKKGIICEKVDKGAEFVLLKKGGKKKLIYGGVVTDQSAATGYVLSKNKFFTHEYLKKNKYPVLPKIRTNKYSEAEKFLNKHKVVVVKPPFLKQGKGISVNLKTKKDLRQAWNLARKYAGNIIVEKFFAGEDLRVLVIDYKHVFAVKRYPAYVMGDGKSNIKKLIEIKNRKGYPGKRFKKIMIDNALRMFLKQSKLTLQNVPAEGEKVVVRGTANVHTGGETEGFTDSLSSDMKKQAIALAKELRLPVVGVDYLVSPNQKTKYIIELNADPGFKLHHFPILGKPEDPTEKFLQMIFK